MADDGTDLSAMPSFHCSAEAISLLTGVPRHHWVEQVMNNGFLPMLAIILAFPPGKAGIVSIVFFLLPRSARAWLIATGSAEAASPGGCSEDGASSRKARIVRNHGVFVDKLVGVVAEFEGLLILDLEEADRGPDEGQGAFVVLIAKQIRRYW